MQDAWSKFGSQLVASSHWNPHSRSVCRSFRGGEGDVSQRDNHLIVQARRRLSRTQQNQGESD